MTLFSTRPIPVLSTLCLALSLSLSLSFTAAQAAKPKATEPVVKQPVFSEADQAQLDTLKPETRAGLERLSEAMQEEAKAVGNALHDTQDEALKDIAMLWQAAVERSNSIRYAIEKLSKQDATGQPVKNDSMTKKLLQNVTRLGGVASSMMTASPAGMIGSSMVEDLLMPGNDPTSSALNRVTDADMVILAKEVESLQSKVIELYYRYKNAEERWQLSQEAAQTLTRYYDQTQDPGDTSSDNVLGETVISSLYESAKQDEAESKQAFASARNELGMLVGADAVQAVESARQAQAKATP